LGAIGASALFDDEGAMGRDSSESCAAKGVGEGEAAELLAMVSRSSIRTREYERRSREEQLEGEQKDGQEKKCHVPGRRNTDKLKGRASRTAEGPQG
jgi:hypothetical protein